MGRRALRSEHFAGICALFADIFLLLAKVPNTGSKFHKPFLHECINASYFILAKAYLEFQEKKGFTEVLNTCYNMKVKKCTNRKTTQSSNLQQEISLKIAMLPS